MKAPPDGSIARYYPLKRYGLITKAEVRLYAKPNDTADIVAIAGRNILLEVQY